MTTANLILDDSQSLALSLLVNRYGIRDETVLPDEVDHLADHEINRALSGAEFDAGCRRDLRQAAEHLRAEIFGIAPTETVRTYEIGRANTGARVWLTNGDGDGRWVFMEKRSLVLLANALDEIELMEAL